MTPVILLAASEPTLADAGFMFLVFIASLGLMTRVMGVIGQAVAHLRRGHSTSRTGQED